MLIFQDEQVVLFTPPDTMPDRLRKLLLERYGQRITEATDSDASRASFSVDAAQLEYRKALLVRHPLDLLRLRWEQDLASGVRLATTTSLAQFVQKLISDSVSHDPIDGTIWEITSNVHFHYVVHIEQIEVDLRRIGIELGHIARSNIGLTPWQDAYDAESLALALKWAEPDLISFGYDQRGVTPPNPPPNYRTPTGDTVQTRLDILDRMPNGGVCAEVGVFCGDFSAQILESNRPSEIHLIDLWSIDHRMTLYDKTRTGVDALFEVRKRFADEIESGQVQLHRGRSLEQLATFDRDYFDWVYIDANHYYYDTFAELCLCANRVKPGGYITGHDYCEIFDHGVVRAVDLFCREFDFEMEYLTSEEKLPAIGRVWINADVPRKVAYNSFALRRRS